MRANHWFIAGIVGFLINGFATIEASPTPETQQALAPTGKLRVGFFVGNSNHAIKDPVSGELKGPAVDLGKEMARRLGVPFEPVPYTSFPPILAGAKSGAWDIATMGITPGRAKVVDFSPPYMEVETGYLVPNGSSLDGLSDVDNIGVRIAVQEKGAADVRLSAALRNAVLVRASSYAGAVELLRAGSADALAGVKPFLSDSSKELPGSRILDGRISAESIGFAVAKGRDLTYIRKFVESAKAEGIVKAAIERAGLVGVVVAP